MITRDWMLSQYNYKCTPCFDGEKGEKDEMIGGVYGRG